MTRPDRITFQMFRELGQEVRRETPDNKNTCRPAANAGTPGRPEIYPPGKPGKPGVTPPREPPSKEPHRPEITPVREPPSEPPRPPEIKPGKHPRDAADKEETT